MKKLIQLVLFMVLLVILAACSSSQSITDDLQSQKWNVVSTNGESYTAQFGQDTVTFGLGIFNLGMDYTVDGDILNLIKEDETYTYEVSKEGKEFKFTAADDKTHDKYGHLTLSPAKE